MLASLESQEAATQLDHAGVAIVDSTVTLQSAIGIGVAPSAEMLYLAVPAVTELPVNWPALFVVTADAADAIHAEPGQVGRGDRLFDRRILQRRLANAADHLHSAGRLGLSSQRRLWRHDVCDGFNPASLSLSADGKSCEARRSGWNIRRMYPPRGMKAQFSWVEKCNIDWRGQLNNVDRSATPLGAERRSACASMAWSPENA